MIISFFKLSGKYLIFGDSYFNYAFVLLTNTNFYLTFQFYLYDDINSDFKDFKECYGTNSHDINVFRKILRILMKDIS